MYCIFGVICYPLFPYECVIKMLQFVNEQRRFRRLMVETAERAVIDVGIGSAE